MEKEKKKIEKNEVICEMNLGWLKISPDETEHVWQKLKLHI